MVFRPQDLPNPFHLTAPENMEYLRKLDEAENKKKEARSKRAHKKAGKTWLSPEEDEPNVKLDFDTDHLPVPLYLHAPENQDYLRRLRLKAERHDYTLEVEKYYDDNGIPRFLTFEDQKELLKMEKDGKLILCWGDSEEDQVAKKPAPKRKRGGRENFETPPASPKKPAKKVKTSVSVAQEEAVRKPRTKTTAKKSNKAVASKSAVSSKKKASADVQQDEDSDLFSINLEGDGDGTVEIYDSCDEIRSKILAHLSVTGCTKAAFLRDIARAGYSHEEKEIKIQSKQLTDFLDKDGATAGSTSRIFYGGYVYFEKKRIFEKVEKSTHRLDMEDAWEGKGGLPRKRPQMYTVRAGSEVYEDELGRPFVCRRKNGW
ncbi:hypothetical protein DL96DRAFT_1814672 [Flagelloscypha sp. PMI_526]|nr:hypothetical protein DL96DRAFT_1814672 [Flagelloscypha sp. PMI_526]